nr:hypothetical protein [uncultured Bacteroides sp.]
MDHYSSWQSRKMIKNVPEQLENEPMMGYNKQEVVVQFIYLLILILKSNYFDNS